VISAGANCRSDCVDTQCSAFKPVTVCYLRDGARPADLPVLTFRYALLTKFVHCVSRAFFRRVTAGITDFMTRLCRFVCFEFDLCLCLCACQVSSGNDLMGVLNMWFVMCLGHERGQLTFIAYMSACTCKHTRVPLHTSTHVCINRSVTFPAACGRMPLIDPFLHKKTQVT
jgi:hypothetical protein